jgi:hypothetical protein
MEPLSAAQLLDACERGRGLPPVRRALFLLEVACPDEPPERLAALPVGRRDACLLALCARTFGPTLAGETRCPACGERLELDLQSEELGVEAAALSFEASEPDALRHDGYEVVFRLPTSVDLAAAGSGEGAEARLLTRLVVEARCGEEAVSSEALPAAVRDALGEAMAAADPLADLELGLTCPACGHDWAAPFDPAAFFWAEIEAGAPRLLRDVHRLASAYAWSERDVLAMSAWRRGQYLSLLST